MTKAREPDEREELIGALRRIAAELGTDSASRPEFLRRSGISERKVQRRYPELGRAAARDIPGARLVELEGVGHVPHLEAPECFQQALLEFLGG